MIEFLSSYPFFACVLEMSTIIMAVLHILFFKWSANISIKIWKYILYIFLIYIVSSIELNFEIKRFFSSFIEFFVLWSFGVIVLKCKVAMAAVITIIAVTIPQIGMDMFGAIMFILGKKVYIGNISLLINIANLLLLNIISFVLYKYISNWFFSQKIKINKYMVILFTPVIFVFMFLQFITDTLYNEIIINDFGIIEENGINDYQILFMLILAYFCIFGVLFACKKVSDVFDTEKQNALQKQQIDAQSLYIQEAQAHYNITRSFRHDIKNHMIVLNGLLNSGYINKAKEYLNKLEKTTDMFYFTNHTGNIIIDILLNSKFNMAYQNDINVKCCLKNIDSVVIENIDLCIVFANALDNALKACIRMEEGYKYINISSSKKGKFFMLEFENSCNEGAYIKGSGIGLHNIKAAAEKYNGTISIEQKNNSFKLNVLFILSQQ